MELALNLGWMAIAMAMCWLWVRYGRRGVCGRSAQLISLALVLFMMFVVITTYDDMAMAQSPADARCFQREDSLGAQAHVQIHPVVASIPAPGAKLPFNTFRYAVPGSLHVPTVRVDALSSIQNRPPPAA
jgi:hypothetical protein